MTVEPFRLGHAAHSEWRTALDQALAMVLAQGPLDTRSDLEGLGIVYVTSAHARHLPAIVATLRERTGFNAWVGGVGHGVLAAGHEYQDEPALVLMMALLPMGSFSIFSGKEPLAGRVPALGSSASGVLVHADPAQTDLGEMLTDVGRLFGTVPIFGGVVGGDLEQPPQLANTLVHGGLSGVVFNRHVGLFSRMSQGCAPLGTEHFITGCTGHYLRTLDGEPALDVMLRDLGVDEHLRHSRDGDTLLRALPAGRLRRGLLVGLATDPEPRHTQAADAPAKPRRFGFSDFLVRNIIGIDPENRVVAIAADLNEGDKAVFCTRDQASARNDLVRMCTELREELEGEAMVVIGALYFSCVARGRNLFGKDGAELAIIRHNLGDIPVAGFFANGEIANARLYAYTGVLTLFTAPAARPPASA